MENLSPESIYKNCSAYANRYFLALLTFFYLPISGIAIDIFVPSLPAISQHFNVAKSYAQLTITVYMIALGLMQLFAGCISDSYGRRKPFLVSASIAFIASYFIPLAGTIQQLLFLRFVQGIAIAISVVPLRSVIADLFEGNDYYKMTNYMVMVWSIGPIIAPALGGYLQYYSGWQANFYFLATYNLLAFILIAIYLPETSVYRHPFRITSILSRYKTMLSNKNYLVNIVMSAAIYSITILFALAGPFLLQTQLHFTAVEYGYVALLCGLAWCLGTLTNRLLIHLSSNKKMATCLTASFLISVIALLLDVIFPMNIYLIVIPIYLITWLGGIVYPNLFARAVALFPQASASANALFAGMMFLITGLNSGLSMYLKSSQTAPMAILNLTLTAVALFLFLRDIRTKQSKVEVADL